MTSSSSCFLIAAAAAAGALFSGATAAAQTWTAQPPSADWDAAAVARWESGATMVARCRGGDFRLIAGLVAPMEGLTATMRYAFDEGEPLSRLSALAESRRAVFVRQPADFARALMTAQSLDMTVSDGRTPQQRYVLEAPGDPEVLGEVLSACGEPLIIPPNPPGTIWTNPDWARLPSASQLASLFPPAAAQARVSGRATVQCIVTIEGRLVDCLPVAEEPEGHGFAAATIAAAERHFHMRPALVNGEPVGGALVTLPLRWVH